MPFGRWYPLAEAARHAPSEPGVFQVRLASGLIDYPEGKSAMVHYELATDVCLAATAFADRHPGRDWLCRHTIDLAPEEVSDPGAVYARLVRDFRARFGVAPSIPTAGDGAGADQA
jgi:hypothetical protein